MCLANFLYTPFFSSTFASLLHVPVLFLFSISEFLGGGVLSIQCRL